MGNSFREKDMNAEKKLGEFMDRCFYSKLCTPDGKPVKYERIHDRKKQLEGIDIILDLENKKFKIDEKASLYYSNAMIPTFAFEIDSIQQGHNNPVGGWFVNNSLATEYYMLIWPNIKCKKGERQMWVRKEIGQLQTYDFTIVEAMLIEKRKLTHEIEKRGYDTKKLIAYAKKFRAEMNNSRESVSQKIDDEIKIMYSGMLAEKPINAIINKSVLKSIADAIYLIAEDGYAKI